MIAAGLFLLLIVVLICGFGCQWLAEQKGYATSAAFIVGALCGPLGLLIYAGAPDLIARRSANRASASGETSERTARRSGPGGLPEEIVLDEGEDVGETSGEDGETKPKRKPAKFEFPDGDWDQPSHRGPLGG